MTQLLITCPASTRQSVRRAIVTLIDRDDTMLARASYRSERASGYVVTIDEPRVIVVANMHDIARRLALMSSCCDVSASIVDPPPSPHIISYDDVDDDISTDWDRANDAVSDAQLRGEMRRASWNR